MNITPEEAVRSLREIEASRLAMRSVIRAHRGHLYLWIWGTIWIAVSLLYWIDAPRFWVLCNWISVGGVVATIGFALVQRRQVRSSVDKRFLAVCVVLLAFGYGVWPVFLGQPHSYKSGFGFSTLIWMQIYMVAGIWFDNYWLWIGLAMTVLIVAGFLFFPAWFWVGPLLGGVTLVGTGFYIRRFWK